MRSYIGAALLGCILMAALALCFDNRVRRPTAAAQAEEAYNPNSISLPTSKMPVRIPTQEATTDELHADEACLEDQTSSTLATLGLRLLAAPSLKEAERLIDSLLASGDPRAVEYVLDYMKQELPHRAGKAEMLWKALCDCDDDRIAPAARLALEQSIVSGHHDWTSVGYAKLAAAKGGLVEVSKVLELVENAALPDTFRTLLADSLAHARDPGAPIRLREGIDALVSGENYLPAGALARSLARIGGPASGKTLWGWAQAQQCPADFRRALYEAWGMAVGESAPEAIERHWHSLPEQDKEFAIGALAASFSAAKSTEWPARSTEILRSALAEGSEGTFLAALSAIDDNVKLLPAELAAVLRSAARRAPSEKYRDRALALADTMEKARR